MSDTGVAQEPDTPEHDEDFLTRREASAYLERFHIRLKPASLARLWCVGGDGPPCRHVRGRPLYPRAELRAWALSQQSDLRHSRRRRSTGETRR